MNDQLDRALTDGLRRDAARMSGRGPGFGDVRRRARQRRQRTVVLGAAPALLGAAWLATRPTPASIGVGAGNAPDTSADAVTTTSIEALGLQVACVDDAGNPVDASLTWVDGVATVEVKGEMVPAMATTTTSFVPPDENLGVAIQTSSGVVHCEWYNTGDDSAVTPTTVAWVSGLGVDALCVDATGGHLSLIHI